MESYILTTMSDYLLNNMLVYNKLLNTFILRADFLLKNNLKV